jgi:hypothetical protein
MEVDMANRNAQAAWGIIIYADPDHAAKFDGWCFIESWARGAREYWRGQYPNCTVEMVRLDDLPPA